MRPVNLNNKKNSKIFLKQKAVQGDSNSDKMGALHEFKVVF